MLDTKHLSEWLFWPALRRREEIQNVQRGLSPNFVACSPLQKASPWQKTQKERCTHRLQYSAAYLQHIVITFPELPQQLISAVSKQLHFTYPPEKGEVPAVQKKEVLFWKHNPTAKMHIYAHGCVLVCVSIVCLYLVYMSTEFHIMILCMQNIFTFMSIFLFKFISIFYEVTYDFNFV